MKRIAAVLMAAALASGCAEEAPRLEIRLEDNAAAVAPLLTVTAVTGDWIRQVEGTELYSDDGPRPWEVTTPGVGTLRVHVELVGGAGEDARTVVELGLRSSWRWGIRIHLTDQNPVDTCARCFGHQTVAVPAGLISAPNDSLYVIWGGGSLSDDLVF